MVDLLFVYGSLRVGSAHRMQRWLSERASHIAAGRAAGRLFRISWYPALVENGGDGQVVVGDLYRLHEPEPTLARLDVYEGCDAKAGKPREYERVVRPVSVADGRRLDAWLYIYRLPVDGACLIESGDFLAT